MARKNYILDRMEQIGFINTAEAEEAKKEMPAFAKQKTNIKAPHFVMYVKNYLEERYGANFVENAGLRVVTTLDFDLQQKAEKIIERIGKENEKKYKAGNAALAAVDPRTGQLLVMVGSRDYFDTARGGNFNVATSKNRQPGSAFKPIAYAEFLRKGYPPRTILFDAQTEFSVNAEESYRPENYDNKFRGPVSVESALAQSLNIPAVKVLYLAGMDEVIRLAHNLGITTLEDRSRLGLSLVLGGGEVSPLDMAYVYSVFANEGIRNEKAFILKIEDGNGSVLEEWRPHPKEILEKNVARTISAILSNNDLRAPVFGAQSPLFFPQSAVAAKTGTTQNYKDAWVAGYAPSLAATVWVGNNNGAPMEKGGAGIAAAGPIFHEFMSAFLDERGRGEFTPPEPILSEKPALNGNYIAQIKVKIDKDSGMRATSKTPPEKVEEKIFPETRTILRYVDKKNPLGDFPRNPAEDPQYANWEYGVQNWLKNNPSFSAPYIAPPDGYDTIHTEENMPKVEILSPAPDATVSDQVYIKASITSPFKIKGVDFYLNGVLFSSDFEFPYEAQTSFSLLGSGQHALLARAYDIYDNVGEKMITVIK